MKHGIALASMVALLFGSQALAQYQNRSIGLNIGYADLDAGQGLDWAVPVGLHATLYFDNHIEGVFHAIGMLVKIPNGNLAVGFDGDLGARYLFMTDVLRPYVGADVSYFQVFAPNVTYQYAGVGPTAGVDYFLNDSWSIGLRANATVFFELNDFPTWRFGLAAEISTWY